MKYTNYHKNFVTSQDADNVIFNFSSGNFDRS